MRSCTTPQLSSLGHGCRGPPLPRAGWAFGRRTKLSKSTRRDLTRRSWLCRSPAASEPRSDKEPHACRPGTPLRIRAPAGATLKRPRLRVLFWAYPSRHPQRKPLRVPPIWRRQSAISLPGFSHPGGTASSAWFRGLLHRPPSAARTTEQRPISGQGILPCEVHAKFVKEQGTTGTTRTTGTPIGEALVPVVPVVLVVISFPSTHIYGSHPTTRQ